MSDVQAASKNGTKSATPANVRTRAPRNSKPLDPKSAAFKVAAILEKLDAPGRARAMAIVQVLLEPTAQTAFGS